MALKNSSRGTHREAAGSGYFRSTWRHSRELHEVPGHPDCRVRLASISQKYQTAGLSAIISPIPFSGFCFVSSSGSHNRHPLTRSQISTCQAKLHIAHQVTLQPSGPTVRADRVHLKSRFLIKAFSSVPDSSLGFSSSNSHFGFINSRLRALLWSPNKLKASLGIKSVCKYPWDMSSPSLPGLCLVGTEGAGGGPAPLCLPPPHCSCPC